MNDYAQIPFFEHEGAMMHLQRTNRRLAMVAIVSGLACIACCLIRK